MRRVTCRQPDGRLAPIGIGSGTMATLPLLLTALLTPSPLPPAYPAPIYLQVRQAPARPALWVVNDNDTIIYLFGTFHALDGRTNWFDQSVRTAFAASDQL